MADQVWLTFSFALYTFGIVVLGVVAGRGVGHRADDYFLAKRRMPGWLVAFAAAAASESGWVMMGLVGASYVGGVSAMWLIPGCILGYAFNLRFLGPRLTLFAGRRQAITVPEVIGMGCDARYGIARRVAAGIALIMVGSYVAAQFNAAGKAFTAFLGLPYTVGTILGAAIVICYTALGGQRSITWTHLVQASMMVLALVVVPVAGLMGVGVEAIVAGLRAQDPALVTFWDPANHWTALGVAFGWSGIGLGYLGQPHVLQHYMSGRSPRQIRSGWAISVVWATMVFSGAILTGLVVRATIGNLSDPEHGLPVLAASVLPAWIQGLVLAAILAAICSTADSQLLALAATLGLDLSRRPASPSAGAPPRGDCSGARIVLIVSGLAALLLALTENRAVFTFVLYAWGVMGASLGPIITAVVIGRRFSNAGAVITMSTGAVAIIGWPFLPPPFSSVYELIPAFALSTVAALSLSQRTTVPVAELSAER